MIMVFAGTSDGREILYKLEQYGLQLLAATATEYGGSLISDSPNIKIYAKPLNDQQMKEVFLREEVHCIIDATHPYAINVSRNLIQVCEEMAIDYIRYERPTVMDKDVTIFDNYDHMISYLRRTEGNILLTIGSNHLAPFTDMLDKERLYARVLPTPKVIEKSLNLGIKLKNLIALQGPFSKAFNKVMLKDYHIKYLVTKDSGKEGGTREKIEAAKEMGVEVFAIHRPKITYPLIFNDITGLMGYLKKNQYFC